MLPLKRKCENGFALDEAPQRTLPDERFFIAFRRGNCSLKLARSPLATPAATARVEGAFLCPQFSSVSPSAAGRNPNSQAIPVLLVLIRKTMSNGNYTFAASPPEPIE